MQQIGNLTNSGEQSSPEPSPVNASPTTPLQIATNAQQEPPPPRRSTFKRSCSPTTILIVSRLRLISCIPLAVFLFIHS